MRITDEAVDEFIKLYREEFGHEISRSEASKIAFELVTLYETLAKRLPNGFVFLTSDETPRQRIGFRV